MSEPADDEPAGQAVARPSRAGWRPFHDWAEARARFKDLLVVFFGVYAAFLLNRFETDRRDTVRRRQLLEALEHKTNYDVETLRDSVAARRHAIDEFDRKLAAGERPQFDIVDSTGYSATDDATLLQAGGAELFDVEILDQLRIVNQLQRLLMEESQNFFRLELTYFGSFRENSDIYDPVSGQLRKHFVWYPGYKRGLVDVAQILLGAEEKLLVLIKAKRHAPASGS